MSIPRNLGNFADNVNANGKVEVTGINATGTPSASTALLGNGTWGTVATSPAGSNTQIQYNNAGAFGASSALTFDGTNLAVTQVGNPTMTVKTTGAGNNPLYRLQADTNYWDALGVFSDANDTLRFRYNGTDYLTLNNTGAVGFGSSLSYGTSGQVLTSAGSGSAPTWTTPSAGALVFLSSQTVTTQVASVDFTSEFSSAYDDYVILFENLVFSGSTTNISLRIFKNSALITSSSYLTQRLLSSNGTTNSVNSSSTSSDFGRGRSNAQTFGEIKIFNANSTNASLLTICSCLGGGESSVIRMSIINTASNSFTGIRLYDNSATYEFTSGTFRLYGVAKS